MSEQKIDYTLCVGPKSKTRYVAGKYDEKLQCPRYEASVSIWKYQIHNVEIKQFLMGKENNYTCVFEIENKSDWPAFIIIKKDGILLVREKDENNI